MVVADGSLGTIYPTARLLRAAVRSGGFRGQTAGQAPGFVQTNVVIVPEQFADDFEQFCRLNSQACPLVTRSTPGDPTLAQAAAEADIRTDVPEYRVFRYGLAEETSPENLRSLWRDDLVTMLIGCSFTFERALQSAGLPVRHIELRRNVPMYRTNRPCIAAGPFSGPLVVSMRPYRYDLIEHVTAITGRYPRMHGAPIHVGDPAALGIVDINKPDFGDAVPIGADEAPVFWACGVTPQAALEAAKLELAITHRPGCMFVTDLRDEAFCEPNA